MNKDSQNKLITVTLFILCIGMGVWKTKLYGMEYFLEVIIFAVIAGSLSLLEKLRPVDPTIKPSINDILYSFFSFTGTVFTIVAFVLTPIMNYLEHLWKVGNLPQLNLSTFLEANNVPLFIAFIIHLLLLDFFDYWRHRFEHKLNWWWELHKLHHNQKKMTFFTLDRNHILATLFNTLEYSLVATFLGIYPSQFAQLYITITLIDYLSHANAKISFGPIIDKLIVSPLYHRAHHSNELSGNLKDHSVNFANLFPLWDIVFGTADFSNKYYQTGVKDDQADDSRENILLQHFICLRSSLRKIKM